MFMKYAAKLFTYCQNHTKSMKRLCGHNAELHTTGLQTLTCNSETQKSSEDRKVLTYTNTHGAVVRRPLCLSFPTGQTRPCYSLGQLSRYSDSLQPGRSGNRIPVGVEIFRPRPDRPWDPPSLLYSAYRVFPGGKAAEAWC